MSKYSHNVVSEEEKNSTWYKMLQWVPDGKLVLDVGCSSGYFGEKLMTLKRSKLWGIDIDEKDAREAEKRGYERVLVGDLDTFDWSRLGKKRFDTIVFADVLEHVKNPLAVLRQSQKVLAPGGSILVSTPNIAHISIRIELMEGNFDYEDTGILDNTHLRFFTEKTFLKLFQDAGMEIAHFDARVDDPPEGQVAMHLKKLGLEPTKQFEKTLRSNQARAFQFVAEAKMATGKASPPSALHLPSKLKDDWPKIAKKMEDDDKQIKTLQKSLSELRQTNDELNTKLRHIHRHPLRWLAKKGFNKAVRHGKKQ